MAHFASLTDLVDPLRGASIFAATASEKPCSLIAEALRAMNGDLYCQISVRDLIEGLCQQVGQNGQAQWDLSGHGHLIPKPRHVGPPRNNQNDSLAWGVQQLLHHFA